MVADHTEQQRKGRFEHTDKSNTTMVADDDSQLLVPPSNNAVNGSYGKNHSRSPLRSSRATQRLRTAVASSNTTTTGTLQVPQLHNPVQLASTAAHKHNRSLTSYNRRSSLTSAEEPYLAYSFGTYGYSGTTGGCSTGTGTSGCQSSVSEHVSPSTTSVSVNLGSSSLAPNSSTISSRTPIMGTGMISSSRSSPRSSFSSSYDSFGNGALRRHSEQPPQRRPSAQEVFDVMEREQDAIVLKLMREIHQLKEDNRALSQTINALTNSSTVNSQTGMDALRTRRHSSILTDEEWNISHRSMDSIPRSARLETLYKPTTIIQRSNVVDNRVDRSDSTVKAVHRAGTED